MQFTGFDAFAQTVLGVPSNTTCPNSGIVTASSTLLGATPQYQLLKSGVVVYPVSGDTTQFTNTNTFTGLLSGNYIVKGRASSGGAVYTSSTITVTDGYTQMSVTTPTKVASCIGGTTILTSTIAGGKSPFVYKIASQASPSVYLETSISTSSTNYNFVALVAGSYLVSVTDACGQTITGAASVSNPTISIADIRIGSSIFIDRTVAGNCIAPIIAKNELGFTYVSNNQTISAADASLFTYKIKFQGQLYGQDINADGYSDLGGTGFSPLALNSRMPLIATRDLINTEFGNMFIVLSDACGNTKEFPIKNYNTTYSFIAASNCNGIGYGRIFHGYGMYCLPINLTFTNTLNPADVVTVTQTSSQKTFTGLTTGATYNVTYTDAAGYSTGLYKNSSVVVPAVSGLGVTQSTFGTQENLNALNYGKLVLSFATYQNGDTFTYMVTASNNPLVAVGYSNSATLNAQGTVQLPRVNLSDPLNYWPKGNYTLAITTACGTSNLTVTVKGFTANLSGNTITPVCGGFNYLMNGTFDVQSAYQVIIVSGPASVGQTRDLASTSASLPFNGLVDGNYVFGLRIKGGVTNVLTQVVTYSAANAIAIDTASTGGYICSAGAINGILTIVATTNSPAPSGVLEYAISLDGGTTFGTYQSANTFSGLGSGAYFFKVKDGCGNVITQSAQIGVAAAPTASADGQTTPVTFCNLGSGTIQLDVDILGANSYSWAGPGITAANQNIKNTVINYSDLSVGSNTLVCTITLGTPCNTTTVSNLTININPLPNIVITNPAAVCYNNKVNITLPAVTAGSDVGLTYAYFTDAAGTTILTTPTEVGVSGTYYIKGTNSNGCTRIVPVTVTINPLPIATIAYLNGPYCTRGKAIVTQSGITGGTYSSDAGVSINSTTGEIDLTNSAAGSHTVTYSFTNGICTNVTTAIIVINDTKLPTALADITAQCSAVPIAPTLVDPCAGGLTATPNKTFPITTQGTTIVTWTFNYGNGYTQTVDQNVILDDTINPVIPTLTDIISSCSVTPTASTTTDSCTGTVIATTTTVFPITAVGTTVITWIFDDGNGNSVTSNQNVTITNITKVGPESTTCASDGSGYTVTVEVSGQTPFVVTGIGAPGTWSGNIWTSSGISTGTNYNVIFQDVNACNSLIVSGTAPDCCVFDVVCPTFPVTTIACYAVLPTTTLLTESQFETLGNADGVIGNLTCGVIEITASNAVSTTCEGNVIRTYTITEYADPNNNYIRDLGENTVLNIQDCIQTYIIERLDFTMPANQGSTVSCAALVVAPIVPVVTDNCGNTLTASAPVVSTTPVCEGDVTYTYTFTDCEGNTHDWVYTYTIERLDFTMPANQGSTVSCASLVVAPIVPVVTDNCGNTLTASAPVVSDLTANEGDVTYTYTFIDCVGNSHDWVYTYTIDNNIAPKVIIPIFTQVATICLGDSLSALPTLSNNGISGSWSPAINNLATTTYTFTPAFGQCATTQTMTIQVNSITPIFVQPEAICIGEVIPVLPTTSLNGISGSWFPALNNLETTTYVFTPNSGQCASTQTITIEIKSFIQLTVSINQIEYFNSENQGIEVTVSPQGNYLFTLDNEWTQNSNVFENITSCDHKIKVQDLSGCGKSDVEIDFFIWDYPKFFTPNGDGINDYWNIYCSDFQEATITIYDRYGKLIKQFSSKTIGWDGKYNGVNLYSTDYWFTVEYKQNGLDKIFKSHFAMKR